MDANGCHVKKTLPRCYLYRPHGIDPFRNIPQLLFLLFVKILLVSTSPFQKNQTLRPCLLCLVALIGSRTETLVGYHRCITLFWGVWVEEWGHWMTLVSLDYQIQFCGGIYKLLHVFLYRVEWMHSDRYCDAVNTSMPVPCKICRKTWGAMMDPATKMTMMKRPSSRWAQLSWNYVTTMTRVTYGAVDGRNCFTVAVSVWLFYWLLSL